MLSGPCVLSLFFLPVVYGELWQFPWNLPEGPGTPALRSMTAEDVACLTAFPMLNFNVSDYARYPVFFDENSVMSLPPAGEYKGIDAIAEYVRFATPAGGVTASSAILDVENGYFGIQDGLCSFYQWFVASGVSTALGDFNTRTEAVGTKLLFNMTTSKIDFVLPAYLGTHLSTYWSYHDTTATAEFVCQIMEGHCGDVFIGNGLTSQADCLQRFNSLPMVSGDYWFDGNSKSCRMMHAAFSALNPLHCAHMSFDPMTGHDGQTKCQTSLFTPVDFHFLPVEWQAFETFAANKGLPTGISVTTPPTPAPPAPTFMGSCSSPHVAAAVLAVVVAAFYH